MHIFSCTHVSLPKGMATIVVQDVIIEAQSQFVLFFCDTQLKVMTSVRMLIFIPVAFVITHGELQRHPVCCCASVVLTSVACADSCWLLDLLVFQAGLGSLQEVGWTCYRPIARVSSAGGMSTCSRVQSRQSL